MTEVDPGAVSPAVQRAFARKVRFSKWALFFERLWPRLWLLIGLAALFIGLSFAGLWPNLSPMLHQAILAAFALSGLAAVIFMARVPWPTRDDAVRRLEQRSGVPHRPATSYEDQVTAQAGNPETMRIWQAHRERLRQTIERLRVGPPSPRADRFDPMALRALALLLLIPAGLFVTGSFSDRIASAFRFAQTDGAADQRIDAWVSPPPYTAVPPVMLADGAASAREKEQQPKFYEVPEHSLLTLRGSGIGSEGLRLEILADGATAADVVASEKPAAGEATDMAEVRYDLKRSARVRALSGGRELAHWTFSIIPDQLPKIVLDTTKLSATPRGSMRFSYKAEDDYGVASAQVKMKLLKAEDAGGDRNAWARPKLTGPRLPLERPPPIALRIPQPGAKTVDTSMLLEFGEHPWAGQRVSLWLEATDVGNQVGRSEPVEMVLPERRFKNPLARSLIEMRRKLTEDSRNRSWVTRALAAVTLEPEGFIPSNGIYLGLRGIYHRLERSGSREAINQSISELWQIALQVEDGDLSDAERALKDAQDRLSDALQKGADDAEINRLIADLKQKLNDYLQEMQKQAQKNGSPQDQGMDEQQQLGGNDLEQMLQDLERNAKQGAREEAEKMLSELRELMDRLQAETPESRQANQRAKEMMNKLSALDDLADKQRQLMDETFGEQRQKRSSRGGTQPGNPSDNNQQGEQGQPNDQGGGQQGQGQQGQGQQGRGQQGQGQQGQGQQGRQGQGSGQRQMSEGDLRQRQAELREQLNQLQKDLENLGAGDPDKLGRADEAMQQAEQALRDGDFGEAAEQQGDAIEQMRQTAQQMAQQMQQNAQQRLGRNGNSPRDPLGRPQSAEGPDLGTSVKVPDQIDTQRAREILDELRKRSGQNLRPPTELDYIDRLLKRF